MLYTKSLGLSGTLSYCELITSPQNGWNIIHRACSNRKTPSLTKWLLESMTVISDEDKSDLLKQKTTVRSLLNVTLYEMLIGIGNL